MDIESIRDTEKPLYEKNTFLIIEDLSAKHDFSLCLLEKNLTHPDKHLRVIFLRRDDRRGVNYFKPDREETIDAEKILLSTDEVEIAKYIGDEAEENELDHVLVFLKKHIYNKIRRQVKEILTEKGLLNSEGEPDLEDESQIFASDEIEIVDKADRKKVLGRKKAKISKQKASTRKGRSPSIGKKVKGTENKVPKAPKRKKELIYKKGKFNRNVTTIEASVQYESKDEDPDFSCCQICNNKETLRAVLANNDQLFSTILNTNRKITSFCSSCGPDSAVSIVSVLLKNHKYDSFFRLLQAEKKIGYFAPFKSNFGFSMVDTGYNDKYAYGVATRRVEMARGNREGTNAFLYDSYNISSIYQSENELENIFRYFNNEDAFLYLATYEQSFLNVLESKVAKIVLFGNRFLAMKLVEKMYLNDGWGFGKFHFLALSAQNEADLIEMKKVNTKKKASGNNQITPIHMACINPNPNILKTFLDLGEEIYIVDELLRKPIHYAAACETTGPLQLLLERGIDCRDYDKNKMTPLMYAAIAGRANNIKLMCNHVPYNVNFKSKLAQAAIHYAVLYDNLQAVSELINFGANVNLTGKNRMTPLMIAAQKGYFDIVQFLLDKGAKILSKDKYKKSALLYAVMNGHLKIASYLLERGADFLATDSSGNSAIHFACAYGQWEILELLVKAGGDINAPNSWNLAPILVALMKNHYRCVMKLTEFPNINVNCQDNNGLTLLMSNVCKFTPESLKIVEFLINNKNADVNISDFSGNTALHMLAIRKVNKQETHSSYQEAVKQYNQDKQIFKMFFDLLISSGIDVNQRNLKSYTALEIAVDCQNWLFIELLLDNPNLDWLSQNFNNKTIAHNSHTLFYYKRGREIIEYIISKVWYSEGFHKLIDVNGYNFYHSILVNFLESLKINQYISVYAEKIKLYQYYLNMSSQMLSKNEQERAILLSKIKSAEAKKLAKFDQTIGNFERFNEFLRNLGYDFSLNVSVIKESYKDYQNRIQATNRQNAEIGNTNIYSRNVYSNTLNYDQVANENSSRQNQISCIVNDKAGCSVLHLSMIHPIKQLLTQLLKILMESGCYTANLRNYHGETVFYYFANENAGNREIARILLEAGENPNLPTPKNEFPFLIICQKANQDIFVELLAYNVDLDIKNDEGLSPLIHFSKNRKLWNVQELLAHGANINIQDKNNRNALHWAINNNQCEDTDFTLEDFLVNRGIDINAVDIRGRTPLHYFFCKIGNPLISATKDPIEIISDFLINKHLLVDVEDNYGNTPLIYACQRGAYLSVVTLHKKGANLNHQNKDGNRPIAIALLYQKIDVAVYLLQQNVEFNIPCYDIDFTERLKWQVGQEIKKKQQASLEAQDESKIEVRLKDLSEFLKPKIETIESRFQGNGQGNENNHFFNFNQPVGRMGPSQGRYWRNPSNTNFGFGFTQQEEYFNEANQAEKNLKLDEATLIKRNFLKKIRSIFELALIKKADSIMYLLIASGFQIGRAVYESIKNNLFNYAIKLLNKKIDNDPERNLQAFNYISEKGRNLFHLFALKSSKLSPDLLNSLYDLLLGKRIQINVKDHFGMEPMLYAALKSKNMMLVNKFVSSGVSPVISDELGNNLITCFVQNNQTLKSSFRQTETKLNFACSKSPLVLNVLNPFDLKFGIGVFEQIAMIIKAEKEKRERMNLEDLISRQNKLDNENLQLSWLKSFISSTKLSLDQPFVILKGKPSNIPNVELNKESSKSTTLLLYIAKKLQNLKLLELVIECGANLNSVNEKGHTILTHAIRKNNILLIMFLLQYEKNIDFHFQDSQGKTYLHHIVSPMKNASYQNLALLEYFASRTSIDTADSSGQPPLYYALQQDSGIMANHLRLLGATDYPQTITRMPTSIVCNYDYPMNQFNFEEDHYHYVEIMKNKFKDTGFEIEEIAKLDPRLKGELDLVYDQNSNQPYDVKLIKVDIEYGNYSANLFYIMQIAFDRIRKIFLVFTSWGRVGTDGQFQQTPFFHREDAIKEFKKIFKEKTGNEYEERANFEKKPNKYRLIKTVPRHIHPNLVKFFDLKSQQIIHSNLASQMQQVMRDLTDTRLYKIVYSSIEVNQDILPFGYLDKELIEKAQIVLNEIKELTQKMENGRNKNSLQDQYEIATQISEKTSEYLEIIPRKDNRTEQIPAFSSYMINREMIRLNNLRYMEVVSRILAAANYRINEINPLDYCFSALNIKMVPLEANSEEFSIIKMYLKTGITMAAKEIIKNIFAIERKGEADRFKAWLPVGNRRLLWHGTHTENLMAILYNGLRISPTEGGHNGSNLGKGIYFSDAFQRSLPFSSGSFSISYSQSTYIMLAEVALGKMHKSLNQQTLNIMPADCQSVKGQGRRVHDKNQRVFLINGCMVPIGDFLERNQYKNGAMQNFSYSFEYNEYVVYDPAQVKIRYLIELDSSKVKLCLNS